MLFSKKNLIGYIVQYSLVAGSAILMAVIVIWFFTREINTISQRVVTERQAASMLTKKAALFSALTHDVNLIGENDTLIQSAFLSSDNILPFVTVFDEIATKNTVLQRPRFDGPSLSELSTAIPLSTIVYTNTMQTDIKTFLQYLRDFEDVPYFTTIQGINVSSSSKEGWVDKGDITLRATLYTNNAQ